MIQYLQDSNKEVATGPCPIPVWGSDYPGRHQGQEEEEEEAVKEVEEERDETWRSGSCNRYRCDAGVIWQPHSWSWKHDSLGEQLNWFLKVLE